MSILYISKSWLGFVAVYSVGPYLYYFSGLVLDPGSNTGRLTLVAAAVTNAAPTIHGLRKLNHVKCYDEGALVDIQILIC